MTRGLYSILFDVRISTGDGCERAILSAECKRINADTLKQAISLAEVAQQYTSLTKISRTGELQGACPLCGVMDRFHIKGERYYRWQCYPRGGDVIDLVMRQANA